MAEAAEGREQGTEEGSEESGVVGSSSLDTSGSLECPICLQPCMHPVELPCHHVFCFLCIKGVAMQGPNSKCAICRSPIPYSVLTNPHLKDVSQLLKEPKLPNGYQWYYESRSGGWWQYDERTMQDLERAFSSNQLTCQLLVAGHIYTVDFTEMIQFRSNNRSVSRRIKRGINLEKRGVAGIRISGSNAGAGSSGGGGPGDGQPPPAQGAGASSSRRRRLNPSASSSVQTSSASSGQSSVPGNCSVVSANIASQNPPNHNVLGSAPRQREDFSDSDDDDESIDEDEDYNSDYSDVDEDMELGEEEEALIGDDSDERETEDEEEHDTRDGARAPTRRSDRSNSSNNQTPPPPSGSGITNGTSSRTYSPNSNGRSSRGARSGRNSGGGRSSNGTNGSNSRAAPLGLPSPQSPASSNSNVLTSLFFNSCNVEDVGQRCNNVVNHNIYLDLGEQRIIDQSVFFNVSQTIGRITNCTTGVKLNFDKRCSFNHEEFL